MYLLVLIGSKRRINAKTFCECMYVVLRIKPRALFIVDKCSTPELHPNL